MVPPFAIAEQMTLVLLAQTRPSTVARLASVEGMGQERCKKYGPSFIEAIATFCARNRLNLDTAPAESLAGPRITPAKRRAFSMFMMDGVFVLFVVCYWLIVVCCLLFVVCCLLFVVCCLLWLLPFLLLSMFSPDI